jgi:hypothetical protein
MEVPKCLNQKACKTLSAAAQKQVFVGVAFALGVGDVRNTTHGPGIGSEPTTLRLTVARAANSQLPAITVDSENTAFMLFSGATECGQFWRRLPQEVPKVFSGLG